MAGAYIPEHCWQQINEARRVWGVNAGQVQKYLEGYGIFLSVRAVNHRLQQFEHEIKPTLQKYGLMRP